MNIQTPKLHFRRFEFKYHLTPKIANKICADLLNNNMIWDPYVLNYPDKSYTVTTLYLDSPSLKCYNEKIHGVKDRFKLRFRIYKDFLEPDDNVFLEIKRKKDMAILKDRTMLSSDIYNEIFYKGKNILSFPTSDNNQKTLEEFFWKKSRYSMSPMIYIRYKRKPLVSKFNDRFRVTFDSSINASYAKDLFSRSNVHEISPNTIIMEVKYNNTLPYWFLKIIHKHQLDRSPFSKYCAGVLTAKKYNQF